MSYEYNSLFFDHSDQSDSNSTYYSASAEATADEIILISISSFLGLLFLFLCFCCFCSASFSKWIDDLVNSSNNSDETYADIALRRSQAEEEEKKEDPAVRREKLLESFHRNQVSMTVTEYSFVPKESGRDIEQQSESGSTTDSTLSSSSHSDNDEEVNCEKICEGPSIDSVLDDFEANEPAEIYLSAPGKKIDNNEAKVKVANSCAICLCSYDVDDVVVWSSNKECVHAFHEECILQWLVKNQNGECPCCRAQFTDLKPPEGKKSKDQQQSRPWSFRGWRLRYNFLSQAETPAGQGVTQSEA